MSAASAAPIRRKISTACRSEGKARIGLPGGDALVRTCAERGIGVDRRQAVALEPIPGDLRLQ